jgi:hypothetical protein
MLTKKNLIVAGAILLVSVGALTISSSFSQAAGAYVVSAADLQKVGFKGVTQNKPNASGRFQGPNLYFEVSDKVAATSEAPNLVMVSDTAYPYNLPTSSLFKYGADSHNFTVAGGLGQEATLSDGRLAINFIQGKHYAVIIGPNKQKIEALTNLLAQKIQ